MQTFLPYPDFQLSAQVLDYRRLGKQRSEALIIMNGGWPNHPASKMWRGYEYQLAEYGKIVCIEWINRGYKDNTLVKFEEAQERFEDTGMPSWMGNKRFHLSHQSNLIRKYPVYYEEIFLGVPDNLPYIWPVK